MSQVSSILTTEVGAAFFGDFSKLRPVQEAAIVSLGAGRSAIISAGTGSGKTEAVVAPLISRYRGEAIRDGKTVVLYICPTKALINDLGAKAGASAWATGAPLVCTPTATGMNWRRNRLIMS